MHLRSYVGRQVAAIQRQGHSRLASAALWAVQMVPLSLLAVPAVLLCRLIRPWLLVRWGGLVAARIGHFAANTELYLCERDAGINRPLCRHVDVFYLGSEPVCNTQLARMWKRLLTVVPKWLLLPVRGVNQLIPGGAAHEIGDNTQSDRDVRNLLDGGSPHLRFTAEEEARGESGLRAIGIAPGTPFVCLIVRDDAYLDAVQSGVDWRYHDYRDSDIRNYVLAADALAARGYSVIRMGARVRAPLRSNHSRVIDYATNGMRDDFMDIYLGARCAFCVSVGTGFDAVPIVFRRPVVYVNMVPLGYFATWSRQHLGISKHHVAAATGREMTLREILGGGAGFLVHASDYEAHGIRLVENSPEEIRDVVVEMSERLAGTWRPQDGDGERQARFWSVYRDCVTSAGSPGRSLHGQLRARFGAAFLRDNSAFAEAEPEAVHAV